MNTPHPLPMLATLGNPPASFIDYAVEAKFDGQRGMAVIDADLVTLLSRNGADITGTFPEISRALGGQRRVILDGEIVALDEGGVPSFSRLQRRWPQNRRPSAALLRDVPVRFYVFDVLQVDGLSLVKQPYRQRRNVIDKLAADLTCRTVQFPKRWTDTDPCVVLAATAELGLEGIVCKHLDSPYTPGLRSKDWIKTPHRKRSEFVIGGWLPGLSVNRHTVGALLVGAYTSDGRLQFCGVVGAGLSARERRRLATALAPLECPTSPFADVPSDLVRHARWVCAELVGDIEYREFRGALRHPSWKGLRADFATVEEITVPVT